MLGCEKGNVGPASVASKTFIPTDNPHGTPNATEKFLISKTISKRLFRGRSKDFIDKLKKFQSCKYLGKYNSLLGIAVDFALLSHFNIIARKATSTASERQLSP